MTCCDATTNDGRYGEIYQDSLPETVREIRLLHHTSLRRIITSQSVIGATNHHIGPVGRVPPTLQKHGDQLYLVPSRFYYRHFCWA